MPTVHYPSNYYNYGITSAYNNDVTRRLDVKRRVAWAQSARFGGQWLEPKGLPTPFDGTIMDAVAATQQLLDELNQVAPLMPDLGIPLILSTVSMATSLLTGFNPNSSLNGAAMTYFNPISTQGTGFGTPAFSVQVDGISISTGQRILYYGLNTPSWNGVWGVTTAGAFSPGFSLYRAQDLANWWQFVKPKVYLVQNGTVNKANTYALQTDAWQTGPTFTIGYGTNFIPIVTNNGPGTTNQAGTAIIFNPTNYSPGIGTTTQSLIYPPYVSVLNQYTNPQSFIGYNQTYLAPYGTGYAQTNTETGYQGGGEYNFLAADSLQEWVYIRNRAHKLAYRVFKMRENYTPQVSSFQNDLPFGIGLGNTQNNVGRSVNDDLPTGSRYPSSFFRGF